jgi:hypothetical protein
MGILFMPQKYRQNGKNVIKIIRNIKKILQMTLRLGECTHCNVQKNQVATQTKEYNNASIVFRYLVTENKGTNAINIKKKKLSHINGIAKSKPLILEANNNRDILRAVVICLTNIDMQP